MQVIFRGDPNELARSGGLSRTSIDMYGLHFQMGEAVDVSALSDVQQRKLSTNPHFEVVAAAVASVEAAAPAPAADEDAEEAEAAAAHAARAAAKRTKK